MSECRFKVCLRGYLREERGYLSIWKNSLVRRLSEHITKLEEYDKSSAVNQFAFTVENFHEATNHDREKGAEFLSPEPSQLLKFCSKDRIIHCYNY